MSPTTIRPGARALGALLVSAALVGVPSAARAESTPTPSATTTSTATPTVTGSPTPPDTPTASATPTTDATPTAPAPASPSPTPTGTTDPSPTDPAPSSSPSAGPSASPDGPEPFVSGGDAGRYGVAAAAGPATSTDSVLVAANYLEEQLRDGGHHFSVDVAGTSYPDYGVTADAVLALAAAGTGQDEAALATQYLADTIGSYASYDDGDPTTVDDIYAGSVAKLLNVAVVQGVDPTAFGGWDLVATLEARENAAGRFVDQSPWGDYSNTFGQSLALIGLHRAGATVSGAARDYLVAQQCPNGGFALDMTDAGCTDGANADPDATAMAVQALLAVGGSAGAATDGLDYLAGLQEPDGALGGAGPTAAPNANSTGLAGQAFLAGGRSAQARAATGYLTDLQYGCSLPVDVRGGIAYDQAAFDARTAAGADATPSDQDRRSTTQALLALAGTPLGTVTATGADAEAPTLACATTPSPSPTSTATPTATGGATSDPTDTAGSGGGSTSDPAATDTSDGATSAPVAAAPAGALAQTGSDPLVPVLVGLALLVLGGLAVLASRTRRGAHA